MSISKYNISDIGKHLDESYDLYICSSSFEDRCLSTAKHLGTDRIKQAFIVSNNDLEEFVVENKNKLLRIFGEKGLPIEIDSRDPLITADNFTHSLMQVIDRERVETILLDVTTFTHESLLILLRLLQLKNPLARLTVIYSNASEYSVGDDVNHKWLSRGIGEIRTVLGYPGEVSPSQKNHLILIVGYEHERAAALIEAMEPNSISLGYGRSGSATTDKDKEANEHYMRLVKQMTTSFNTLSEFEIPCNDPYGTRDEIVRQINKAGGMNILLSPMNNKLSTIGAALACFEKNNVQICYAQALQYNYINYSSPGEDCYVFEIGKLSTITAD